MSKISILATDLDGTLFYDRENITDADREALARASDAGVIIVLATGRELSAVTPALDRLELWPYVHYIIHSGGSYLYDAAAQKNHALGVLTPEIMGDIFDRYADQGVPIVLPTDNTLYTTQITERLKHESELLCSPLIEVPNLRDVMTAPNGKLIFNGSAEEMDRLIPIVTSDPDPRWEAFRSHENYIDCYTAGVNKGTALAHLCETLDIPLSRAAAIGDNHNDLDLLLTVGLSGCPGDGADDAKSAAKHICCNAADGAFADFCRWLEI